MLGQFIRIGSIKAALAAFSVVLLTACGGGGGGDGDGDGYGDSAPSRVLESAVVSGSVGDGPITGATVEIYNVKGELLRTETSDNTASYKSSFKAHARDYPLFLKVSDGIDLVTGDAPDFELVSVMMHKSNSTANINPFSTLIVKMAENMAGGVNADNISYAKGVVMEKYSFGLDPNVINNPVSNRISSKTVAQIVKSSEAMGEMIRRTRDLITATGNKVSGDNVMDAIAADMADGFLDGMGASGSDPTISAVANIVSGQVLVEAMTNELKVNGVIATVVIDQAIKITHSSKSADLSASVHVTSGLINQTKLSVAAAQVIDSSSNLADLAADIDNVAVGSSAADASSVLSANASSWLEKAVTSASTADAENVNAINLVASNLPEPVVEDTPPPVVEDTPPPVVEDAPPPVVENMSPDITGSPASSVIASSTYSFKPDASDADGDVLSFKVSNKPAWANFNSSTGRLNGVPAGNDVGTYKSIVISVSDSVDTVSLPAFSIQVEAEPVPETGGESVRVTDNLVAFYPFVERSGNVVRDLSGSASPMDLTITGAVNWYGAGNGVVMSGGRVGTAGPATELINTLRASNTSSFEVWVEPGNLTQEGPTRMISVGMGWEKQNFVLGQVGDDLEARLLHTGKQTTKDGRLNTNNGVLDASLVHLVHTYDGAVERLYVNGVQHDQTAVMSGGYGNWDMSHAFSIGNEASSDRPYNGTIRMVAVYDRPLGTAEIQQNFAAGPTADNVGGTEGANYVPVISGEPAGSAATDESYNFKPAASDADGDKLEFSIIGRPAWADFDTTTGRLSGIPTLNDAGVYDNIVISVTDNTDTVSLPAFSIKVSEPVQVGSFSLSWTAPTLRSDGTPLSLADISGYRIYYGEYEGNYTESVKISNGTAQSAKLTDIPVGTYFVVMSTYDIDGRESSFSNYALKTAQ